MPIRRIDHTYIKTRGANTNDILRVNSGNLEYISGNTVVIQALYGLAGNNVTIDANGKINATATGGGSVTQANLTTANVVELNNLYFSNARVKDSISKQTLSNATFSGDIVVGGLLRASAQGGDEGGQIELANAITNSTLNGPVNIDVYQNKLRIFESSGSNRGVYVDLSAASVGVGTNLIGGGTGTITQVGSVTTGVVPNSEIVSILTTTGVLTTANVTELNNLYYTNARVYSNVIGLFAPYATVSNLNLKANVTDLTTSNVVEGTQLYYSNARARTAVSSGTGVSYDNSTGVISIGQNVSTSSSVTFGALAVTGNVTFYGNVTTYGANNLVISDNMIYLNDNDNNTNPDIGIAGNYNDGAYKHTGFFRDASDGNWKVYDSYTLEPDANIFIDTSHGSFRLANIQANVFIGDLKGNVIGALQGTVTSISNFSTTDLREGSNLYYTNARVYSNVIGLFASYATTANLNLKANVADLTTSNVVEGNNLYYTNSRVYSNVVSILTTYTGNINAGNLIANSITTAGTSGNITGVNYITANYVLGNVISSGNVQAQYFLGNGALLTGITAGGFSGNTSGVAEGTNLYYTNARVRSNVIALLPTLAGNNISIDANGIISATAGGTVTQANLTTSNVVELTNLYYTNARVYSNVISLLPNYTGNLGAGNINVGNLVISTTITTAGTGGNIGGANYIFGNYFQGNLIGTNTVDFSNTSNVSLGSVGNVKILGGANGYILRTDGTGNVSWVVQSGGTVTQANLTTSNVVELTNLYYTNARVRSNVVALLPNYGGNILAQIIEASVWNGLYTGNVTESGINLYFSNIRARQAVGASTGVIYDVNTGLFAIGQNVAPTANVTFNNLTVTGTTTYYGNVTTYNSNNLVVGENMIYLNDGDDTSNPDIGISGNYNDGTYKHTGFFRDATDGNWKVYDSYTPEPSANIFIDTNHASFRLANIQANVFVGSLVGNVTGIVSSISNFSTTNLREGSNLYYSNDRVRSNIIALLPTLAGDNITIDANGRISSTATGGGSSNYGNSNVIALLTTLAGSGISISANGIISATGGGGSGGSGVTTVKVDSFVANGSQTSFALSIAPQAKDYTFVNIDGVEQLRSAYSLSGSTIILSEAPSANANIDVTTFYAVSNTTLGQPAFVTRTYTGTGSQTNFTVTPNVVSTGILVTENGILQTPDTDYTVSGNVLTFTTAPASNVAIQIRELGTVFANVTSVSSGGGISQAKTIILGMIFN